MRHPERRRPPASLIAKRKANQYYVVRIMEEERSVDQNPIALVTMLAALMLIVLVVESGLLDSILR